MTKTAGDISSFRLRHSFVIRHSSLVIHSAFHSIANRFAALLMKVLVGCVARVHVVGRENASRTGGFFSRSPANIERVKAQLEAGNVYINRSCTGAIVGRHPFGGFKMSGSGTKAGGEDYLLHFLIPRVVTENTSQLGLVPEETPEYREEFLWPKQQ